MKTPVELPCELVRAVELRASQEGRGLEEEFAELVRRGLAAIALDLPAGVLADESALKRRRQVAEKFISGEWGTELDGFEAGRKLDRDSSLRRESLWRETA